MKVSLDSLDEEIKKALEDYNVEVVRVTNESIKEAAKEAAKTLKNGDHIRIEREHTPRIGPPDNVKRKNQ